MKVGEKSGEEQMERKAREEKDSKERRDKIGKSTNKEQRK